MTITSRVGSGIRSVKILRSVRLAELTHDRVARQHEPEADREPDAVLEFAPFSCARQPASTP